MSTSRVLFDNYLTSITMLSNIAVTGGAVAQSAATVEKVHPIRQAATSAILTVSGTYTSFADRSYRVEIHVVTDGLFTTSKWRWSDTGGVTWNAENLTTVNGGSPVSLSYGVQILFTAGATNPQFALGDAFVFRVILKYGPVQAADGSRNTEYRSGTVPPGSTVEWQLDLGAAQAPTAFALLDENAQTVTLKAKASGFTDPPTYSEVISPGTNGRRLALITPGAFRYWRVTMAFSTAPTLGYLRWSEIFLGAVGTFGRTFNRGFTRERRRLGSVDFEGMLQAGPGPFRREYEHWTLDYQYLNTTDQALLTALRDWIQSQTYHIARPFFWVHDDSDLTDFQLVHWTNDYMRENASNTADSQRMHVPLEFSELVRSLD